jgi:two-component system sensor histidine kinase UhpB
VTEPSPQQRLLARLRTARRVAGIGSWEGVVDQQRRTHALEWSPEVLDIVGWAPAQEPTFADFVARIHPDDRPMFFEARDAALAGTRPYRFDLRLVRPDGEVRHIHLAAEVHRDADGAPERLVGVIQDRTEEVESLRSVRAAEATRRLLLERLLDAADRERERLARRLETGAVAQLRGVEATMAEAIGAGDPAEWREALDSVRRSIASIVGVLSAMSAAPSAGDLSTVVTDLVADAAGDLDVRADIHLPHAVAPALRPVVVRLVQEGLQNTRKHAGATIAEVAVRAEAGSVQVRVADDGRGFDLAALHHQRGHFGIASLRDDVAAVGGELELRSGPDGTVLEARLPHR